MDQRVKLQAQQTVQGPMGDTTSWVDVATVWAEVRYLSGIQAIKAGAPVGQASASIKINRRTGLSPSMRAVHKGKAFEIQAVLPDEVERIYTFLVCKEIQP